ncbi:helix-turn-helix domain-containing protein [Paraburkholderia nemoris]
MKVFARVAESGGFTAAATRLNMVTGQVSRQLSVSSSSIPTTLNRI